MARLFILVSALIGMCLALAFGIEARPGRGLKTFKIGMPEGACTDGCAETQVCRPDRELCERGDFATTAACWSCKEESKDRGEKKAARGEKKAARGEKKAARGEKKAARGEKKAARGGKAARGEKKAARGEKKAARGNKADRKAARAEKRAAKKADKPIKQE
eukprot:UC1_evm4s216